MLNSSRDAPLDALRVVALIGVFAVNWIGYISGPYFPSPLGPAMPADSALSIGVIWLLMTLLQGKAYPIMAFAVGYSLQSAWLREVRRSDVARATAKRRARDLRMGVLGLAHGFLLYAGDILLAYAVVGFVVVRYAARSPRILRAKWRKWLIVWLIVDALVLALFLSPVPMELGARETYAAVAANWGAWWSLNAASYSQTLAWAIWFLMPQLLCFAVGGMWAARWRLCAAHVGYGQRARFATQFWARCMSLPWLMTLLAVNAALAWIWLHDAEGKTTAGQWAAPLWYPASGALALAYLAAFMRWARHANAQSRVALLAQPAKRSLSCYLALSLLAVLSLHASVGQFEHSAARTATAALLYIMCMLWAARSGSGRLETWVSGK
jgi:uncharacterized protein